MAAPEDEDAIEALTPERSHEPLREGVRERSFDRGADDPYVLGAEDLIEAGRVLTVPVADEETKETAVPGGDEVARLLADPGASGVEVTPARCTLRVATSMKKSAWKRLRKAVSTVRKSQAIIPAAWALRNSLQESPARLGAGSMPSSLRIDHTVLGAIAMPRFWSSPWIRR